jgi:hypothetical protein
LEAPPAPLPAATETLAAAFAARPPDAFFPVPRPADAAFAATRFTGDAGAFPARAAAGPFFSTFTAIFIVYVRSQKEKRGRGQGIGVYFFNLFVDVSVMKK